MSRKVLLVLLSVISMLVLLFAGAVILVILGLSNSQYPQLSTPRVDGNVSPRSVQALPPIKDPSASLPLDPWEIDAVPVEAMVLLMPFSRDGMFDKSSFNIDWQIWFHFRGGIPRNIGLVNYGFVAGVITSTSDYTSGTLYTARNQTMLSTRYYTNATHILTGTYENEGGNWIAEAKWKTEHSTNTKRFVVPAGNNIELANQVCAWIAGLDTLPGSEEWLGALKRPIIPGLNSSQDPLWGLLWDKPTHPLFVEWAEELSDYPNMQYMKNLGAITSSDENERALYTSGSLPLEASLFDHFEKIVYLDEQDDRGGALHEATLTLAKYPGEMNGPSLHLNRFRSGEKRNGYVDTFRQWHKRAHPSPQADAYLALALRDSAWDYRGTGWINTVSGGEMQTFQQLLQESKSLLEGAVKDSNYLPGVSALLCDIYGALGEKSAMLALHQRTCGVWPDQTETYEDVMNYLLPRWGGSRAEGMALIDNAMAARPNNLALGRFCIRYHLAEAQVEIGGQVSYDDIMVAYCSRYPAVKQQLMRAYDRLCLPESAEDDACYAMVIATMLQDWRMIKKVVLNHPQIHHTLEDFNFMDWGPRTLTSACDGFLKTGDWEKILEVIDYGEKRDARQTNPNGFMYVFPDQFRRDFAKGLSMAMTGKLEEGIAIMQDQGVNPYRDYEIHYAKLANGAWTEEDLPHLLKQRRMNPDEVDILYLLAWTAYVRGETDEMEVYLKQAEASTDESWTVIRDHALREMGRPVPAD